MNNKIKALPSYFTGKAGESKVETIYNDSLITCTRTQGADFGEDIISDIFFQSMNNEVSYKTEFSFRTQVKTTEKIKDGGYIRKTKKGLTISLPTALVKLWCQSYFPVVLVLYERSTDTGYWCFPVEQIELLNLEHVSISINVDSKNILNKAGVQLIREKVEDYYNTIFKMDKAKYKCSIYPIWMPEYRLFTFMENINIFNDINNKINVLSISSDMLPTFLSSYNNCDTEGSISCIEYTDKSKALNIFIEDLNSYIQTIDMTLSDKKWVSFVISPVEIISEIDDRRISNLTDWVSFSKIGNKIVTDFDYTFDIGKDYIYTEKTRSTSDNQDFFIHNSGDFAVEIFTKGFSFHNRNKHLQHMINLKNKSFCIVNISKCSDAELYEFSNWCDENDFSFIKLDQDKDKIAICHRSFVVGGWGTLLPGILTWKDWDALDFETESFLKKLPYGQPVELIEKQRIFNKYFSQGEKISNSYLLQYSQLLHSEASCHDERLIRFVTYVTPIDILENRELFNLAESDLEKACKSFKLFYDPYEGIADVVLEVKPLLKQSSKEAIQEVERIYHKLIETLLKNNNQHKNMAFYIKYYLNRLIPENLVCNDND